jgi:hypothetical protein
VALMGRSHPVGVVLAALLFGALYQGGAELAVRDAGDQPRMIVVIQALVILFTGALDNMVRMPMEKLFLSRKRRAAASRPARARRSETHGFPDRPADPRQSTVRLATPLLLACLAGLFSERAGIFDIGLEGKMLARPSSRRPSPSSSGSVWVGLLAGIGASMCSRRCTGGLDHLPRQPADLGRGDQLPCRGPDGGDRAELVPAGRPHPGAEGGRAVRADIVLPGAESLRGVAAGPAGPDLFRADLGPLRSSSTSRS